MSGLDLSVNEDFTGQTGIGCFATARPGNANIESQLVFVDHNGHRSQRRSFPEGTPPPGNDGYGFVAHRRNDWFMHSFTPLGGTNDRSGVLDAYAAKVETQVRRVNDAFVELDDTCFFARSGGQVGDIGWIGGNRIVATERADSGGVRHFYAGGRATAPLHVGEVVEARIDFDRRYRIMRLHSAQHLAELAVTDLYGLGPSVLSGVSSEHAFVDFVADLNLFARVELTSVQRWINAIVVDNVPVERYWHDGPYWIIDGVGLLRCDGTHIARSGEIGAVRLCVDPVDHGRIRFSVNLDSSA